MHNTILMTKGLWTMTTKTLWGAVAGLALMSGGATADVTPSQVWTDFKSYVEGFGYSVTGTETTSGGTLTVSDVIFTVSQDVSDVTFNMQLEQIAFADLGDGRVRIVLPETVPMRVVGTVDGGADADVSMVLSQTDLDMIVSGDPGNMTYDYTAAQMGLRLTDLTVEDDAMSSGSVQASFDMTALSGRSVVTVGALREVEQRLRADRMTFDFSVDQPEEDVVGRATGAMSGLVFTGTNTIPLTMNPEDVSQMLADGFALDGTFTHSGVSFDVTTTEDGAPINLNTRSDSGRLQVGMDASGISYSLSNTGQMISMQAPDLPFPVQFNSAQSSAFLNMPLSVSDASQDFGIGMSMGDLTMSDGLWNLFDPGQILPRDPATLVMDITGKARILVDFMKQEAMESAMMQGTQPAQLEEISINSLQLDIVGASLNGSGAFTFDNTAPGFAPGMPKPTGAATLTLIGANALIDRLIQMGLVGEEEAMGARMMISMFAVPGAEEDSLRSQIEINAQGHILANGMRIQ